ncbi:MAG: hypothetical protein AAGD43_02500 [Pseudomonadota bacterium]
MIENYDLEEMRARIKQLLDNDRDSGRKASLSVGRSEEYLRGLTTGTSDPTTRSLIGIAKHYNVSVLWLLFGDEGQIAEDQHRVLEALRRHPEKKEAVLTLLQ